MSTTTAVDNDYVKANVQYLSNDQQTTAAAAVAAAYHASQAGDANAANHDGSYQAVQVAIRNGRNKSTSLDAHGFQLVQHCSSVADFRNDTELEERYTREVEQLLRSSIPGSKRVVVFDHTRRSSSSQLRQQQKMREPSSVVHNDYTAKSARTRLLAMLGRDVNVEQRFMICNVWRSIAGTVQQWPMAFCDSTTLGKDDFIAVPRIAKDRMGEIQMSKHHEKHQWYYYPLLQSDEVLVFKTFDSNDSVNQFTLHTAFEDPTSPVDAPPRQSLETRAFVFFD